MSVSIAKIILSSLIISCRDNRRKISNTIDDIDDMGFVESYCCVSFDTGRQTGKTAAIKEKVKDGDLIVVSSHHQKECYADMDVNVDVKTYFDVINKPSCKSYNTIFVDDANHINGFDKRTLINSLLKNPAEQMFVLVG